MTDPSALGALLRELSDRHAKWVSLEGVRTPASVALLIDRLEDARSKSDRYQLSQILLGELEVTKQYNLQLYYAQKRLSEFGDVVSRTDVGRALMRLGLVDESMQTYSDGITLAMESGEFLNLSLLEGIRAAVTARNADAARGFIEKYLDSGRKPQPPDCQMEFDWVDKGVEIGIPEDPWTG